MCETVSDVAQFEIDLVPKAKWSWEVYLSRTETERRCCLLPNPIQRLVTARTSPPDWLSSLQWTARASWWGATGPNQSPRSLWARPGWPARACCRTASTWSSPGSSTTTRWSTWSGSGAWPSRRTGINRSGGVRPGGWRRFSCCCLHTASNVIVSCTSCGPGLWARWQEPVEERNTPPLKPSASAVTGFAQRSSTNPYNPSIHSGSGSPRRVSFLFFMAVWLWLYLLLANTSLSFHVATPPSSCLRAGKHIAKSSFGCCL